MVFENLCQFLPAPNFAMPGQNFPVKFFLRNLGNFLLLCLVGVLLWYAVPCPVSDGGKSLHVTLGPMASFLVCYGPYFLQFMQVVLVGELVRHCVIK